MAKKKAKVYKVDEILKAKGRGANRQYLVKWVGYAVDESTWEPADNVSDDVCPQVQSALRTRSSPQFSATRC